MKKVIALALTSVMALSLAACGGSAASTAESAAESVAEEAAEETEEAGANGEAK